MLLWKPSLRLYSAIWCDCIRYTLDDTRTHARITKYVFAQHLLTLARRQNGSIFASTTLNSRGWPLQMIWIDFSMKKKNKFWSGFIQKSILTTFEHNYRLFLELLQEMPPFCLWLTNCLRSVCAHARHDCIRYKRCVWNPICLVIWRYSSRSSVCICDYFTFK